MKRQTPIVDRQDKSGRVLQFKLVGKDRIRVNVTPPRHDPKDKCASCRMDEVVRALGSQNVG